MSALSPFDRAMQAVEQLAAEDVSLFMRTLVGRYPIEETPSLFTGRDDEEIRLLILCLVLGFPPAAQPEMIGVLVEKVMDRAEPGAMRALVGLARWIEASLGSTP